MVMHDFLFSYVQIVPTKHALQTWQTCTIIFTIFNLLKPVVTEINQKGIRTVTNKEMELRMVKDKKNV